MAVVGFKKAQMVEKSYIYLTINNGRDVSTQQCLHQANNMYYFPTANNATEAVVIKNQKGRVMGGGWKWELVSAAYLTVLPLGVAKSMAKGLPVTQGGRKVQIW